MEELYEPFQFRILPRAMRIFTWSFETLDILIGGNKIREKMSLTMCLRKIVVLHFFCVEAQKVFPRSIHPLSTLLTMCFACAFCKHCVVMKTYGFGRWYFSCNAFGWELTKGCSRVFSNHRLEMSTCWTIIPIIFEHGRIIGHATTLYKQEWDIFR